MVSRELLKVQSMFTLNMVISQIYIFHCFIASESTELWHYINLSIIIIYY